MGAQLILYLHAAAVIGVSLRVLLRPRLEPAVRLAWILVVEAIPFVGVLAYLLFGEIRIKQAELRRQRDVRRELTLRWRAAGRAGAAPLALGPEDNAGPVIAANRAASGFPAVDGNAVTLLPEDDSAIDTMVAAIDAARAHVHLLFYIWLPDRSGTRVAEACIRAAGRGVAVRVIVDALGGRPLVRSALWPAMRQGGVECRRAFPLRNPLPGALLQRLDLRNHRKVVVIDGTLAFTGSRNCADMAFAVKPRYAPWVDLSVRVTGPVVRQLQGAFLYDWIAATGADLGGLLELVPPPTGTAVAQVVATGPDRSGGSVSDCVTTLIHAARERLVIVTPYYVPDAAVDAAIRSAAWRGVEVTLYLPARNDSRIVAAVSQGFLAGLADAGVRLRLFAPGLLHAKLIVADDRIAMLGSANLDRRSFELNYELNLTVIDPALLTELSARVDSYAARSTPLTGPQIRAWPWWQRMRNNVLALAAPLL